MQSWWRTFTHTFMHGRPHTHTHTHVKLGTQACIVLCSQEIGSQRFSVFLTNKGRKAGEEKQKKKKKKQKSYYLHCCALEWSCRSAGWTCGDEVSTQPQRAAQGWCIFRGRGQCLSCGSLPPPCADVTDDTYLESWPVPSVTCQSWSTWRTRNIACVDFRSDHDHLCPLVLQWHMPMFPSAQKLILFFVPLTCGFQGGQQDYFE